MSPSLLVYCLGMIMGCRLDLANAAAEYGESSSVLMMLPIDMKKLLVDRQRCGCVTIQGS